MRLTASALARSLVTGALLVLSGCGQKGPLYLPDRNASVVGVSVPPAAQSGPAVPAPAPQPQSAPGQTIPGTPAEPLTAPPRAAPQDPPPRDARPAQPPKRDGDDSDPSSPQ